MNIKKGFTPTPKNLVRGFTLIEIMVVALIIALLASVVIVNVNRARMKGRDAKRISDLNTVASALAVYYADNHEYPNFSATGGCDTSKDTFELMVQDLQSNYLASATIQDPFGHNTDWGYRYSSPAAENFTVYQMVTRLETEGGQTSEGDCPTGKPEYRLKNGELCPLPCE